MSSEREMPLDVKLFSAWVSWNAECIHYVQKVQFFWMAGGWIFKGVVCIGYLLTLCIMNRFRYTHGGHNFQKMIDESLMCIKDG